MSRGGVWETEPLLPENWVADATTTTAAHLAHGQVDKNWRKGYGWHWWTFSLTARFRRMVAEDRVSSLTPHANLLLLEPALGQQTG